MSDVGITGPGGTGAKAGRARGGRARGRGALAGRARPGRGKAARRHADAVMGEELDRPQPAPERVTEVQAGPEPEAAPELPLDAAAGPAGPIDAAGAGEAVREMAEMEILEPDAALAEPGEQAAEPVAGEPEMAPAAKAVAPDAPDDGVEIQYLEDGVLAAEADAAEGGGAAAIDPGTHVLPERCGSSAAHDFVAMARTQPAGARLKVDASAVGRMSCAMAVSLVSAAATATAGGGALVIRSPSNAFTDAFSDLGLFEVLMNMEFAE